MRLRNLLITNMVVALLFALVLLLGPATILKFFGLTQGKTEVLLAQLIGAGLVGVGLLSWLARDLADPQGVQAVVLSLFLYSAIGFAVSLLGILSQVTRSGSAWLIAIIYLLFAVGYAYFQFFGPRE